MKEHSPVILSSRAAGGWTHRVSNNELMDVVRLTLMVKFLFALSEALRARL
jgi:hypothetical protein